MIAEQLRKAVLKASIQGRLTKQFPEDGIAVDLLKDKSSVIIGETPFDIPDNWVWTKIKYIGDVVGGGTPKTSRTDYWGIEVPWITPADMKHIRGKFINNGLRSISKKGLEYSSAKLIPQGSIIFSSRAPIGYCAIASNPLSTNQGFKSVVPFYTQMSEYIYYYLISFESEISKMGTGTTFKEVSGETVRNIPFVLPPLAEQKRIVEKLDIILPMIDSLEKDEKKLEELMTKFPDNMKSSILLSAIQGKLSNQLPEDGIAKVINFNKIDKKYNFEINDVPFDIPENWKWIKLGKLILLDNGTKMDNENYPYLEVKYLRGKKEQIKINSGRFVEKGSRVILVDGENSGEIFVTKEDGYMGSTFRKLLLSDQLIWDYLKYFLLYYQKSFKNNKTGSAIPHLNKTQFNNLLVPIPPYSEQKRIVDKIELLLSAVESLS